MTIIYQLVDQNFFIKMEMKVERNIDIYIDFTIQLNVTNSIKNLCAIEILQGEVHQKCGETYFLQLLTFYRSGHWTFYLTT